MRTAFFGTPAIAVPALRALAETTELVGVVCQPDRPAGRGLKLSEPAVKTAARALGLDVHQPVKVKTGDLDAWVIQRKIDAVVVMAYGRILPSAVLRAAPRGCINLHASLLPKYRGAAPINWAIIHGERETGISLMHMDEGMDTGPVYALRRLSIAPDENAGELAERLAELAATVVREDLPEALSGRATPTAQDEALATYAPPLTKASTAVDWSGAAPAIVNLIRGLAPRPGAHSRVRGKAIKILAASVAETSGSFGPPGAIIACENANEPRVAAGSGAVRVLRAQLEGKKPLDGRDLINGRILRPGDRFDG